MGFDWEVSFILQVFYSGKSNSRCFRPVFLMLQSSIELLCFLWLNAKCIFFFRRESFKLRFFFRLPSSHPDLFVHDQYDLRWRRRCHLEIHPLLKHINIKLNFVPTYNHMVWESLSWKVKRRKTKKITRPWILKCQAYHLRDGLIKCTIVYLLQ